jgi:NTP pyrophosphatase (non-canonical NTP hydrolase)
VTFSEYQEAMKRTYRPNRRLNHILGLCGEAGETADMIKKDEYHRVPYKREEMKKELGDVLWYLTALAEDEGLTLDEIAQGNVEKLQRRYPEGFVPGGGIREAA